MIMPKTVGFLRTGFAALALSAAYALPSAAMGPTPDVYVVMFKADWCAPCKVVEPNLQQALSILRDPRVEYLEIDISNPGLSEIGAHKAFDRNIVAQYNSWLGVTGFAAVIDGDTKQTLGCINMLYDASSAATHIRNLKTFAVANQPSFDLTCPEPNNPAQ